MKCTSLATRFSVTVLALGITQLYGLQAHAAETFEPGLKTISPSTLETRPDKTPRPNARTVARPAAMAGSTAVRGQHDDADLAEPPVGSQLGLTQAVRLAVEWHPSIGEAIGTLYQQGEGINVARAGYYPQITGGIRGGFDSSYDGTAPARR